ncbi:histidine phosphatase family protein [Aromatoleum bremense]|uniref:Histidine phosphatase family protein n=1 Tax=Aromatoleum bremense TaxID=76115 RepID=A0ABX1NZ59_9RHOO|nr:histidine phosphatase family protein [Aromatoleum bremense]NMG16942.1 histidine phosphatase family protein [Aromatoleum bremense]QTQ30247.1 Putative phosphoglycerate mutase [Aromatoleum bremense]
MAELYLVRHGQASFGADNYDQLSLLGQQQGQLVGEYFAGRNIAFDHVLIGTMNRHRQTVEAIFDGSNDVAKPTEHRGLNEYDFVALFDGLGDEHHELKLLAKESKKDFYKALRQVLLLWMEDRIEGPIPETWSQFQQRVADARSYIQGLKGRILAVSSGGVMAAIAQQTLGAPREAVIPLNLQINNCSFCRYFFNADSFHLATFNSIPYFDKADRQNFITYG